MRSLRALIAFGACALLVACGEANPMSVEVDPSFAIHDMPECIHVDPGDGVSYLCTDDQPEEEGAPPSVYVDGDSVSEPH